MTDDMFDKSFKETQNTQPGFTFGGNSSPPPPVMNTPPPPTGTPNAPPPPVSNVKKEEPQEQTMEEENYEVRNGGDQVPNPDNVFREFTQDTQPNANPQQQQQYQNQEPTITEQIGNTVANSKVLSLAGVVILVVFIVMTWRFISGKKQIEFQENEAFYNANPNGGYIDNTGNKESLLSGLTSEEVEYAEDNTEEEYDENAFYMEANTNMETKIASYKKEIASDGRTCIKATLDEKTHYLIHIPLYRYQEIDDEGHILVDVEYTKDKPTFLYISNKQENLNKILNK